MCNQTPNSTYHLKPSFIDIPRKQKWVSEEKLWEQNEWKAFWDRKMKNWRNTHRKLKTQFERLLRGFQSKPFLTGAVVSELWALGLGLWEKTIRRARLWIFTEGLWALGFKRKQFQVLDTNYGNGWKRRGERKENAISETIRTFL